MLESLFNKVSDMKACKKRLQHRCFPVNIVKFLRIAFSIEQLWWMSASVLRKVNVHTLAAIETKFQ